MHLHVYETTTGNTHVSPTLLAVRELLMKQPPPQNLLVDLKSIRAQVPGFTVFSGDLGDK